MIAGFYGLTDVDTSMGIASDGTVLLRNQDGNDYLWSPGIGSPTRLNIYGGRRLSSNATVVSGNDGGGAFQFTIPSTRRSVSPLSGDSNAVVMGASADGQTLVGYDSTGSHAWIWSPSSGTTAVPGTSASSQANDISADGQTVVGNAGSRGFVWGRGTSSAQLITPVPNRQVTEFRRIARDASTVVGDAYDGGVGATGFAFRWTSAGGYQSLGSLPNIAGNDQRFYANACDAGAALIGGTQADRRAWIWDQAHGMRDLRSVLVTDYGYDLTNWTLEDVNEISSDGHILVGQGGFLNAQGGTEFRAFVAVIPTPGTTVVGVAAALLATLGRPRRK